MEKLKMKRKIILASGSPRRKRMFEDMRIDFSVMVSNYEEDITGKDYDVSLVEKTAYNKALEVSKRADDDALIVAADTVVVFDKKILGKPKDKADAKQMLKMLQGNTHIVVTAIAIIDNLEKKTLINSEKTKVTFDKLTDSEIDDYIKTGEPMDKAGAYGIQGLGCVFIQKVDGCYNNVVGLPAYLLAKMLKSFGVYLF